MKRMKKLLATIGISEVWGLGIVYSHNPAASGDQEASVLKFGGAYDLDLHESRWLLLAADAQLLRHGAGLIRVGAEKTFFKQIAVRAGYVQSLTDIGTRQPTGLSTGLGMSYHNITVDYGLLPGSGRGMSHQISFTFKFGLQTESIYKAKPAQFNITEDLSWQIS